MCGRIAQSDPSAFAQRLDALFELHESWAPSWNVGPTAPVLGVRERGGQRRLQEFRWGLVPGWAKDASGAARCFNARAETVATKATFKGAFARRRLLVPIDGFYEWEPVAGAKRKQPHFFTRADGDLLVLAGLWEYWRSGDDIVLSASVITTAAGPDLEAIHDRQPAVLGPDTWERWLDPGLSDRDELEAMLRPGGSVLRHWPVSYEVGSVDNNGAHLVEAIAL